VIISRTPFRVSFFGGGTDYPAWYREHGGAVLSASINKYCYITCRHLPPFHAFKHLVRYYLREEAQTTDDIQHPAVRACLKFMEINHGVDIVHHADVPARSGLGSSSTFTVGLLHALYALKYEMPSKRQLATNAIHVEQNLIGEHVGSQDQTSAAFGSLNRIDFGGVHEILVKPLILPPDRMARLQEHIMLFFTGVSRTASEVAKAQIENIPNKKTDLRQMMQLVDEAETTLLSKTDRLADFGRLLHEQWRIKRGMSAQITNANIDAMYEAGMKAGALGGKLLGAGGGGFLMFFASPERQPAIKEALQSLLYVPAHFDFLGSQIVYFHKDELV
jgi:D-glycero-alpha-D-manno-heptose-7-phosphate kinase